MDPPGDLRDGGTLLKLVQLAMATVDDNAEEKYQFTANNVRLIGINDWREIKNVRFTSSSC